MSYSISNAKDDLEGMMHGGTLNKITNLNNLLDRGMRDLIRKVDPIGTMRKQQITGAIHDEINHYSAPSDLKKVIDISPQVNREASENPYQTGTRHFDLYKRNLSFAIEHDEGEASLLLSIDTDHASVVLHDMDSTTNNGTWAVGGDAENLASDTQYYVSGSASLKFDLDGSGTSGYIRVLDMNSVDLSDEEDTGKLFARVYIPDPDIVTNVKLRWGSSGSDYWEVAVTSPIDSSSFKTGWNILSFDWNGASETGSPDSSAVIALRVTITYDGTADTDFRVDRIVASNGEIWDLKYYSRFGFSNGGTWKQKTTSDEDIVELDDDAYNIWLLECLKYMAQQAQGEDSGFDVEFSKAELEEAYRDYRTNHPSRAIKRKVSYA